jgi:hypothetical protein
MILPQQPSIYKHTFNKPWSLGSSCGRIKSLETGAFKKKLFCSPRSVEWRNNASFAYPALSDKPCPSRLNARRIYSISSLAHPTLHMHGMRFIANKYILQHN